MLKGIILDFVMGNGPSEVPYVKDFIRSLEEAGLKLVFASSSLRQNTASDLFLPATEELGLSPEECLVITDTEAGTMAAKAANIPCIGFVNPNFGTRNLSLAYALLEGFENADVDYLRRTHAHALSETAVILETKRLLVRELSAEEFPTLYTMCSHPETSVWMEEVLSDYETEKEKHLAYCSHFYPLFDLALWGIYEKETHRLIGRGGFSLPENDSDTYFLGYLIDVPYRNRGYAKECVPMLLSYAKKQGYTTILTKIKKQNTASLNVLKACGYPYHREAESPDGILLYRINL